MKETGKAMSERVKQRASSSRSLSLAPLSFDQAVIDILKIRPEPKPPKKKLKAKIPGAHK